MTAATGLRRLLTVLLASHPLASLAQAPSSSGADSSRIIRIISADRLMVV